MTHGPCVVIMMGIMMRMLINSGRQCGFGKGLFRKQYRYRLVYIKGIQENVELFFLLISSNIDPLPNHSPTYFAGSVVHYAVRIMLCIKMHTVCFQVEIPILFPT